MTKTVGTFQYPGGKTNISAWIIQYIPEHEVYVEPFGGSAGVMANKPESPLEVYNDTASLCVDFFRAVKHHPDDLQRWLQTTPYSRELFDEYTERLQQDPPEDIVERAGMFWFVQMASFAGAGVVNSETPNFSTRTKPRSNNTNDAANSAAVQVKSCADGFHKLTNRFSKVQVEHLDFESVFDKYDSTDTVFYCDPPYVDVGDDYYQTEDGGFQHERFVEAITDLDGDWIISYDHRVPEQLQDYHIVDRQKRSTMGNKKEEKTETLIMNFDPTTTEGMADVEQNSLGAYQ